MTMVAFPRVLHASESELERNMIRVARDWAADIAQERPLRMLEATDVAAGTTVYCDEASDFAPGRPGWRIYGLRRIRSEVNEALQYKEREKTARILEEALLSMPAGVLWLNVGRPEPNTPEIVKARLDALSAHWDALRSLALIDAERQPQSLDDVLAGSYSDLLLLWCDPKSKQTLPARLEAAIDACLSATPEQTRMRISQVLVQLAERDGRIKHRDRFKDLEGVAASLGEVRAQDYESARTGATLKRVLYALDAM